MKRHMNVPAFLRVDVMQLPETLAFYLLVGLGVAGAAYLTDNRPGRLRRGFSLAAAALFWPLFVPILLAARTGQAQPAAAAAPADDPLAAAIAQVQHELDAALGGMDGWADDVLVREKSRLDELRAALSVQASRIRNMDALLAQTAETATGRPDVAQESPDEARWLKSEQARRDNLARLCQVRRQAYIDLRATLAWIRELVSMIHLARFTGAPASRAEELVAQIAAAIEGVSAVAADPTAGPALEDSFPSAAALPRAAAARSLRSHPILDKQETSSCDSCSIPRT
jgi:hypothetical protein